MATIEPWGEDREDHRFSVLATLLYNLGRGKNDRPATPDDFLPDYSGEREQRRQQARGRSLTAWVEQMKQRSKWGGNGNDDRQSGSHPLGERPAGA